MTELMQNIHYLAIFLALGMVALLVLIYLLTPTGTVQGTLVEKRAKRDGSKWVKAVIRTPKGKNRSFWVQRQESHYLVPGETGVLQKRALGKARYSSHHTGLNTNVTGVGRFAFQWLGGFAIFVLVIILPYFVYYEQVVSKWQKFTTNILHIQPITPKTQSSKQMVLPPAIINNTSNKLFSKQVSKSPGKKTSPEKNLTSEERFLNRAIRDLHHPGTAKKAMNQLVEKGSRGEARLIHLLKTSNDNFALFYGIKALGEMKSQKAVPYLIKNLRRTKELAFQADGALQKITQRKSLYIDAKSEEERIAAIEKWEKWFRKQLKKEEQKD